MNSKLFVVTGGAAWVITFVVGFFILAPSTDDGYYVIASMGTVLEGRPGFWIGDEFSPVFFLPPVFTYFYGTMLKLTTILGFDFGALGFRVYQFMLILAFPVACWLMLRRFAFEQSTLRFLVLIAFLSVGYFMQSAPTVRPEVLGFLLFVLFLWVIADGNPLRPMPMFVLAVVGTLHPNFSVLAATVFGALLVREYQTNKVRRFRILISSGAAFAVPFVGLGAFYLLNLSEFQNQTLGRAGVLSTEIASAPRVVLDNLIFWDDPSGIAVGLFGAYPAIGLLLMLGGSTVLVVRRFQQTWSDELLWVTAPMFVVQWFVFLMLPPFPPYLAFVGVLATLIVVLSWSPPSHLVSTSARQYGVVALGLAMCLVFISFQGGKFFVSSDERLTPIGFHNAVSPIFDSTGTKFYTASARLIPPLIDHFSGGESIRVNFTYLSPNCFGSALLDKANGHAANEMSQLDLPNTYWGIDRTIIGNFEFISETHEVNFYTKGASSIVSLNLEPPIYRDSKNLVAKASEIAISTDDVLCEEAVLNR